MIISSDYAMSLTPSKAFEQSDSLVKIKRDIGNDYVIAIVTKLLNDSVMFLKNNLEVSTIAAFARMFVQGNPHLKIDELILILTRGINGDYGKQYGNFDYSVLMEWRSKYESTDKADYLARKNQVHEPNQPRESGDMNKIIGRVVPKHK
jgi:hypothetical protein